MLKKQASHFLSLLIVAALVITSLPFNVLAETVTNTNSEGITIDLSATDESLDEVLSNISGLNALANDANGTSSTAKNPEKVADSKIDSVEKEEDTKEEIKFDSGSAVESPATDFEYTIEDSKVRIDRYIGSATEVVIPAEIEGYPVTSIGDCAFYGCSALTSITLPEGVTSIGDYAFVECSALTSITIPEGVTSIGDSAFDGCESLTSITIPDGVTSIGDWAFANCSSLTSIKVSDNNSNYSSAEGVLFDKNKTELICCPAGKEGSYIIPNSVTSIGVAAFLGCYGLTSITLPDGVTSIEDSAFDTCVSLTSITIPEGVMSIGSRAFAVCRSLKSISIPSSVTSIENYAFAGCSAITSITIPDGVTSIGAFAFYNCHSLTSIEVSEDNQNYSSAGGVLFNKDKTVLNYCPEGKEGSYIIPNSVMIIWYSAFEYCRSLTSITIPDSVTSIRDYAFRDCRSLTSITIPDSVTSIGHSAFSSCNKLNHIYYTGTETEWNNIEILIDNEILTKACIHYEVTPDSEFTTVTQEATCTINKKVIQHCNYCDFAFEVVPEKETATATATGHNYANGVCKNCGLAEDFPLLYEYNNGTITITDCDTSVAKVTIPTTIEGYSVTNIGGYAFYGCSALTSITIPDSVTTIGESAFDLCYKFNHIYYTGTETEWNNIEISYENEKLTKACIHYEVTPGSEFTTVTQEATCTINKLVIPYCSYCDFVFEAVIEKETATGHNHVNGVCENCGLTEDFPLSYEYNDGTIKITDCNTSVTEVIIPTTIEGFPVTSIGYGTFWFCSSLISIIIPEGVTSIGDSAFSDCSALTSISIPDSVTSIGDGAFRFCDSLTSITIPKGVTSIGDSVFSHCYKFNHIYYTGTETEWNNIEIAYENEYLTKACIHYEVTPGSEFTTVTQEATCSANKKVIQRCNYCDFVFESVTEAETATGHNYVNGVCENCGLAEDFPLSYEYNNGTITITDCDTSVTHVTIPTTIEGYPVTSIGDSAFYGCSALTSITIPDNVTRIGYSAFRECSALTSISIPEAVTSIRYAVFYGCSALTSITIPDSVTSIDDSAFAGCSALTSISIPDSVTSIDDCVFYGCSALTSISIPEGVTNIGYSAFEGCSAITSISIPDSVTSIGNYVFRGCSALTSITIPEGVTDIGAGVFVNCISLTKIMVLEGNEKYSSAEGVLFNKEKTEIICCPGGKEGNYIIPNSVTSIGNYAFCGCSALTNITIPESVTSIGNYAFCGCESLTSITIPEGVTNIGDSAFRECWSLTSITIPKGVTSIVDYVFWRCNINHIYYTGTETEWNNIEISYGNEDLTIACIHYEVTPGSEFTTVAHEATCTINKNVIQHCNYCDFILEVVREKETATGHNYVNGVCENCGLTEDFPLSYEYNNGTIKITDCNTSVTQVTIPAKIEGYPVTSIGFRAFEYCDLLTSITLPDSVTSIGDSAFLSCNKLNHIYYTGTEIEWNNIEISYENEILTKACIHYEVIPGSEFTTATHEATCTINKNVIQHCNYCDFAFEAVREKETAKGHNYVNGVCENCGLTEDFPLSYEYNNGTIKITDCNESVKKVTIPTTIEGYPVTSIGNYAFEECYRLNHIYYTGTETEWNELYIGQENLPLDNAVIHYEIVFGEEIETIVYDKCIARKTTIHKCSYCDTIFDIVEEAAPGHNYVDGQCTKCGLSEDFPLSYEYYNGKIEITDCDTSVTSIVIPTTIEGYPVTSIGSYSFYGCSALTSITIPDSVTIIGDAFLNCNKLNHIYYTGTEKEWNDIYISYMNESLIKACIHYEVTPGSEFTTVTHEATCTINKNVIPYCSYCGFAFEAVSEKETATGHNYVNGVCENCDLAEDFPLSYKYNNGMIEITDCNESVTKVTIPSTIEGYPVTSIYDSAFYGCSALTSITIPDSVTSIGSSAFRGCRALTSISIPEGVTSIRYAVFYECSALTSITIPDSVTSIDHSAFNGCYGLTSITIPDSVTSIGKYAFYLCNALKNVYYTGSEADWNSIDIDTYNDPLHNATIYFNYVPEAIPEDFKPIEGSKVYIDKEKKTVSFVKTNLNPDGVAALFENAENIKVLDKNGNPIDDSALVGTGCKIQLVVNNEVVDELTITIKGEIDGDGIIDSNDAIYLLRNTLFPQLYKVVVEDDVDGNGVYNSNDAIHLLRYTLFPGLYPLK